MSREIVYDEVFDAQAHFRILLDSMARPGKINTLSINDIQPPAGIHRASVLVGFALLNADASFHVLGAETETITRYLILNTSGVPAEHTDADFLFMSGATNTPLVLEAKAGTLPYPEDSATLVIDTTTISAEPIPDALALTLRGPGVKEGKTVFVSGLNSLLLDAVREQNLEFPLGIDMILTDAQDRILCIPRSNRFSYTTGSAS